MVQMPTGTGKTHLMAAVISEQAEGIGDEHGGVLIVAHRRELIEQIRATIKAFGIEGDKVVVEPRSPVPGSRCRGRWPCRGQ